MHVHRIELVGAIAGTGGIMTPGSSRGGSQPHLLITSTWELLTMQA